jgi:hypothetical protein
VRSSFIAPCRDWKIEETIARIAQFHRGNSIGDCRAVDTPARHLNSWNSYDFRFSPGSLPPPLGI